MVPKICSIDGCTTPVHARGWCRMHYLRWQRNGDPALRKRFPTHEESLAANTGQDGDCIVWTGAKNDFGYGIIFVKPKLVRVHRYAWEKANGPIPDGMLIDHACRNPACFNVEHLRLATHKQNMENLAQSRYNTSGFRGVSWSKRDKKWSAYANHNGRKVTAGNHDSIESAAAAALALRNRLYTHNVLDRAGK